ncbi:Ribosomal-protein-alanine acetyltransferase [Spatholobus suberectus]|nr:Ribosomal-protein-alanine acetyltransferase [Spatholobus suberectus]
MAIDLSKISELPFKLSDVDDVLLWVGDDKVSQYTRLETCGSRLEALTFVKDECVHPLRRSICLDDRSIGIVGGQLLGAWDSHQDTKDCFCQQMKFLLLFNY